MCTFLAIAVPDGDLGSVRALCPRTLHVEPCANRSVAEIVGREFRAYWLTSGSCSCDLAPADASVAEPSVASESSESKLRRKYAARGWSPAKIERAVADAMSASRPREARGLRDDAAVFLTSLVEHFGSVRLVAHSFDDVLDSEIDLRPGGVLSLGRLTTDAIEYDRCHELRDDRPDETLQPTRPAGG